MANSIIKGAGFHHIALKAKDYDKSFKFYTEGLGFKLLGKWGEGDNRASMLDIGDGTIVELFAGGIACSNDESAGRFPHLAFKTTDVDGAYAAAIAAGAKPHKEPSDVTIDARPEKMHVRIAFVLGFDGEQLEFFHLKG